MTGETMRAGGSGGGRSTGRGRGGGTPLLEVDDLTVTLGGLPLIDGVSFHLAEGGVLGLVGESGSGKSITALSILRLLPERAVLSGRVRFHGRDLAGASEAELEELRGAAISMIFQEPMTALNPVLTVGHQIVETIRRHQRLGRAAARRHAVEMLARVGIPDPATRIASYPHEMSGGMRQRVMIAMALACNPRLLIADEPTTALDVTIQAQILELLANLQAELGMSVILITHDLGVIVEIAHEVLVMYAGKAVERASLGDLFERPLHPYTEGLMRSVPSLEEDRARLDTIPGVVPPPTEILPGCRFAPRCDHARPACGRAVPPLLELAPGHHAACIRHVGYRAVGQPGDEAA
jgi:peptide/nickel transport system ATP-binding protein